MVVKGNKPHKSESIQRPCSVHVTARRGHVTATNDTEVQKSSLGRRRPGREPLRACHPKQMAWEDEWEDADRLPAHEYLLVRKQSLKDKGSV